MDSLFIWTTFLIDVDFAFSLCLQSLSVYFHYAAEKGAFVLDML